MQINLISHVSVCGAIVDRLLDHDQSTIKMDDNVVMIKPPNVDFKKFFINQIPEILKKAVKPGAVNWLVQTCRPSENWRLGHIGKKHVAMLDRSRYTTTFGCELSPGWQEFMDGVFSRSPYVKFQADGFDFKDIFTVAGGLYSVSVSDITSKVLYDRNDDIDRSGKMSRSLNSNLVNALAMALEKKNG